MEPTTASKDSFMLELLKRKESLSIKLAQLDSSHFSDDARMLKEMLDEQLANTQDLIDLYISQLVKPVDPLYDAVKLFLTVNYVSIPAVRLQLAHDFADDSKTAALLDFWEVFNGNKGEKYETVLPRAVEYVELYRRRSEVLAPNSALSLKALHDFVSKTSDWLAHKSKTSFLKRDAEVGGHPAEENAEPVKETETITEAAKPDVVVQTEVRRPGAEGPKRKSWADEVDDIPVEETKSGYEIEGQQRDNELASGDDTLAEPLQRNYIRRPNHKNRRDITKVRYKKRNYPDQQ